MYNPLENNGQRNPFGHTCLPFGWLHGPGAGMGLVLAQLFSQQGLSVSYNCLNRGCGYTPSFQKVFSHPEQFRVKKKNLYNKAVTARWYSPSNLWFTASPVNTNSEGQRSKYIKVVARQGNLWDITEKMPLKKVFLSCIENLPPEHPATTEHWCPKSPSDLNENLRKQSCQQQQWKLWIFVLVCLWYEAQDSSHLYAHVSHNNMEFSSKKKKIITLQIRNAFSGLKSWGRALKKERFAMHVSKNEYRQMKPNLSKFTHREIPDCYIDTAKTSAPLGPKQMRFHIFLHSWNWNVSILISTLITSDMLKAL